MGNQSLSHVQWKCQYHIVFIPKYRKKLLHGKLRNDVSEIIKALYKYKDVQIIDEAVCWDHIHLSVAIENKGFLHIGCCQNPLFVFGAGLKISGSRQRGVHF